MTNSFKVRRISTGEGDVLTHVEITVALYGTVATFVVEAGNWSRALANQSELELGDELD